MQSSSPTWPCTLDGIDGIAGFMRLIHSRKCMGNAYILVFQWDKPKISHAGCTFSFTSGNFVNLILRQNRRMWSWIKRPASIGTYQFWALQMSVLSQKIYEAFHTWVCTHHITLFDTMILEKPSNLIFGSSWQNILFIPNMPTVSQIMSERFTPRCSFPSLFETSSNVPVALPSRSACSGDAMVSQPEKVDKFVVNYNNLTGLGIACPASFYS